MISLTLGQIVLALLAGLACGFLNTVASSGSAVSLPILMMTGLDPLTANATNRIPVLLGATSATASFHAKRLLDWRLVFQTSGPVIIGAIAGALLAQDISTRQMGLAITGAVLVALLLLFTKLKKLLASDSERPIRLGLREYSLLSAIGFWFGFIVIDAGTYLLLVLTLAVGLNLPRANAVKNALTVPATLMAMAIFSYHGSVSWAHGVPLAAGSMTGAWLGARFSASAKTRRYVFPLLVLAISGELIHLLWQYAALLKANH